MRILQAYIAGPEYKGPQQKPIAFEQARQAAAASAALQTPFSQEAQKDFSCMVAPLKLADSLQREHRLFLTGKGMAWGVMANTWKSAASSAERVQLSCTQSAIQKHDVGSTHIYLPCQVG